MSESRYQPNGKPLTDYERELLVILMEECAEVIQAASKLIRFGKENRPVGLGDPSEGLSNSVVLAHEIGDLEAVLQIANEADLYRSGDVVDGRRRKMDRLSYFMQYGDVR